MLAPKGCLGIIHGLRPGKQLSKVTFPEILKLLNRCFCAEAAVLMNAMAIVVNRVNVAVAVS